jgi:hypothetical protein
MQLVHKERVTFSDTLAMIRRWLWAEQHLQMNWLQVLAISPRH